MSDGLVRLGIDLQVVPMMERHYKNGFVGPRFMTLEVGMKCRIFFWDDNFSLDKTGGLGWWFGVGGKALCVD